MTKTTEEPSFVDDLDTETILAVADSVREEVRRKRKRAMESADAYWVQEKPRKQPSRIKVSLSRPMSDSEKVWFRDNIGKSGFLDHEGKISSMVGVWQPHRGTYLCDFLPFRARLSANEQIYAESNSMGSVRLYDQVVKMLEDYFVNLHPMAVKTLRELS